ncbi:preprotein translocase subunit SecE [Methylomicrobium sp. Wu6]|uniref:preprotein translocase subunit SecE n=1 Tax=Methylomicrobium sp. Wu6 TaxID=3107928 RepID=UPI002DD69E32|nr:preprotein translocase subunit SecE [Methylomicrobium sp. Wu6]MEC4747072.1 preprotein translocase subunit SecE [Methylomicrobium sp. Wu6]
MNTQAEAQTSILDIVKQVFSAVLVVGGVAAFYYFAEQVQLIYRVLGLIVIVAAVLVMMLTTELGRSVWAFAQESKVEVRKVVWPTKDETTRTTLMVFTMVTVVALILWLLDMFLFWGVRLLTGQGG